jgi:uncharacterized protein YecE (DUF72 family)
VAFEFRNQSWFVDEVYECLRRFGVALCIVDSAEREVPWEATADFGYFRLRRPDYSDEELAGCAQRIVQRASGWQDTFIYFKHEAAGRGPVLAARLRTLMDAGQSAPAAEAGGRKGTGIGLPSGRPYHGLRSPRAAWRHAGSRVSAHHACRATNPS